MQYFKFNLPLLILLIFISLSSIAQVNNDHQKNIKQSSDFWKHVRYGGNIGIGFGNDFFSGTIAPNAVYDFNKYASFGLGVSFSYYSEKDLYKGGVYGGSILGFVNPMPSIQLSAELEPMNIQRNYDNRLDLESENYWYTALFLGAGYTAGNITLGIRFNILHDEEKSLYSDSWMPFFRVYF